MSIPMYFAGNWKDSVNRDILTAQMGYGFYPDGRVRLPKGAGQSALCVVDDAFLPTALPALDTLITAAEKGCCFDFERKPDELHRKLLRAMASGLHGLILLPEPFQLSTATPLVRVQQIPNCWERLMEDCGRRYPAGWALELTPYQCTLANRATAEQEPQLIPAGCWCRVWRGQTEYYDTRESLSWRLERAEKHGCKAAIGLEQELWPLLGHK